MSKKKSFFKKNSISNKIKRRPLPTIPEEVPRKNWKVLCESDCVIYVLVASVCVLIYANSLHGEFLHDDIPAIVTNEDVNGQNNVYKMFMNDFWGMPMSDVRSHKSYRPLTILSFRLNHLLFGQWPWSWHACNVILHAACSALVARAGVVIARFQRPFATLAALLFAVHPIHTEAVAGVVGRADVLACVFFLSSVLFYHGEPGRQRVWSSIVLATLSLLAKETGLTVLLFNIAFDIYRCWTKIVRSPSTEKWQWISKSLFRRISKSLAALVLLVAVRLALLQGSMPIFSEKDNPSAFHPSIIVRFMTFCYLAAFNWWLLLCPWTLSHDWQMGSVPLVTSAWDPRNLLTCAALSALLALSYRCMASLKLQKPTPAVAGLLLLVIPYLPASNLLVTVGFVVAERVLYISSVGSVFLTVYGIQLLWRRPSCRRLALIGTIVLVTAGAARTYLRNRDWSTRETLIRHDLSVLPHNAKLHYNLANFLKDADQPEKAIKHYKEALSLWPTYGRAHNNLGTLVMESPKEAEHHFLLALKYDPGHVNAYYNLARLYRKNKRTQEALKMLERCITLQPRFIKAYLELLHITPENESWIFSKLFEYDPENWEHYVLYGNRVKEKGLEPIALQYYTTGLRLAFATRSDRGVIVSLRAACPTLKSAGQKTRLLQLLTRWHAVRDDDQPALKRQKIAQWWHMCSKLAERAAVYAKSAEKPVSTSTCVHHSQLEVTPECNTAAVNQNTEAKTIKNEIHADKADKISCQKNFIKKSLSIYGQFKHMRNKSERENKQKSCPLQKKKKNNIPRLIRN